MSRAVELGDELGDMIAGAIAELVAAIEHALEVCDACDDGFRTEYGAAAGVNLPELLSAALSRVALTAGSGRLVQHRPGCWEAEHVRALDLSELHIAADAALEL